MSKKNEMFWTTQDGQKIRPQDMTSAHRINVLQFIVKNVRRKLSDDGAQYSDKQIITAVMNKNPLIRAIGWEEGYSGTQVVSTTEVLGMRNYHEARELLDLMEEAY